MATEATWKPREKHGRLAANTGHMTLAGPNGGDP